MHNRRLLQLIKDNQAGDKPRAIVVKAEGEEASIYLYDIIDPWWGVAAKDFVQALNGITAPRVHLHINSPGGDVFEARAMAAAVRSHKSHIVTHIDGLCASAATYVGIAAKEVEIAEGAFFMIHKAWALAMGNSDEMLSMADLLDKVDQSIAADYARKTGKPVEDLMALMAAETWYTAQEAKEAGFADRVAGAEAEEGDAQARALWNLAAYEKAPKALLDRQPKAPPAPQDLTYDRAGLERRLAMYEGKRIAA